MPKQPAPADSAKAITLRDVARLAGLSPITVSRALHNPKMVKPDTIAKVREIAASVGYIPNMAAGSLSTRRSRLIAAVVPQLYNSMFAEAVQGLSQELAAHDYQLLLSISDYSPQREEEIITTLLSRRPDGIVLTGINHLQSARKKLLAAGVPVVETWDLTPTPVDMLVGFSHYAIGEAIGRYLVGKGHQRFGLVWGDDERAQVRRQGLEAVLGQHGIAPPPAQMVPLPSTMKLGREGMRALLDQGGEFDVIVCSSDPLAHGVIIEAQEHGLAVPRQLAVMGFGDFDFAEQTRPAISSVHIDKRAVGVKAAQALIARIEGRPLEHSVIDVGFNLVERETTR